MIMNYFFIAAAASLLVHGSTGGFSHQAASGSNMDVQAISDTPDFVFGAGTVSTNATLRQTGESDPKTIDIEPGESGWQCESTAGNASPFDPAYVTTQVNALNESTIVCSIAWLKPGGPLQVTVKSDVHFSVAEDGLAVQLNGAFEGDPITGLDIEYSGRIQVRDGDNVIIDYQPGRPNETRPVPLRLGRTYSLSIDMVATAEDVNLYGANMGLKLISDPSR